MLHRDDDLYPVARPHPQLVTNVMWALDDFTVANGATRVVPGSHRGKVAYPFRAGSRFEVDASSFDRDSAVALPLKAGDMIIFDSWLLHYSDLNRSSSPRRAIIYTFNPARLGRINDHRFPADFAPPLDPIL